MRAQLTVWPHFWDEPCSSLSEIPRHRPRGSLRSLLLKTADRRSDRATSNSARRLVTSSGLLAALDQTPEGRKTPFTEETAPSQNGPLWRSLAVEFDHSHVDAMTGPRRSG